ncbi:hypothetical protein L1987_09937 [Smallanthus sonchifolius]|uniref:Uncharacterized protein n=1 Tax=Smallanthus sonchifolius TaxID=185202 RepID=A0ACB9JR18_9ASTR|nr:hypothetical protein L1987_09937 [Smallanthus sonchifolius]
MVVVERKHSGESDTRRHCFVIHKEHLAIVLYRVHELPCFRIIKTSICRFGVLNLEINKRRCIENKCSYAPNGFQSIQHIHMLLPLPPSTSLS